MTPHDLTTMARKCYEPDCENEAGGPWSPYWCPECDRQRVERISRQLQIVAAEAGVIW